MSICPRCWEEHQKAQVEVASTGSRNLGMDTLVEELIQLGVMTRRKNGMLDVPDIYRIEFGLGRKGGVPRVRPS